MSPIVYGTLLAASLIFASIPLYAQTFILPAEMQSDAEKIKEIQIALQKLGFYWSEVDGIYDVGLENAITKFVERARERGLSAEKFDLQLSEIDILIDLAGAHEVVDGELGNIDGLGGDDGSGGSASSTSAGGGGASASAGGGGGTSASAGGGGGASASACSVKGVCGDTAVSDGDGSCSAAGGGTCSSAGSGSIAP